MHRIKIRDIKIGDSAEITKRMSLEMVRAFAGISEDFNPVHLDAEYAASSRYKRQIIHGLMATSLFSGLFGTKLPGEGCVYKSQNIKFKRAIYIGDVVTARVEVTDVNIDKKVITFATRCFVNGKVMIDGESEIFVP
ncbi:MaoC family dehydratase [Planktomarina temperata]|jgi:3-hydroxybutyryl-CoA dehydratase|nr:MaoC family dehydratase [Planktomarina temperata]